MAILAPNLATLRAEMNARWPRRDKASDGWIGDPAHQQRPSGHNPDESGNAERQDSDRIDEVRGLDLDKDIDPAPADELYAELDRIRRTPALRRRLIYIIYRRKIASASNGWVWKDYSGDNPHTEHGHLSGHPDYDNDTTPWGVAKGDDMALTTDERKVLDATRGRVDALWDLLTRALNGMPSTSDGKTNIELHKWVAEGQRDRKAILTRIDQVATAESSRDAALAELVRKAQSGELDADEFVDEVARRLSGQASEG